MARGTLQWRTNGDNAKESMKHVHDLIRERLILRAGMAPAPVAKYRLADLEKSEWSQEFETLMRNRLLMGALRYGLLGSKKKANYDRVGSIQKRIALYAQTGNTELLVDAANLCLLEFVDGSHPLKHFHAIDRTDDNNAVKIK